MTNVEVVFNMYCSVKHNFALQEVRAKLEGHSLDTRRRPRSRCVKQTQADHA